MNEEKKALREVTGTKASGTSVGREPCPWGSVSDVFARQYCLPVKTNSILVVVSQASHEFLLCCDLLWIVV